MNTRAQRAISLVLAAVLLGLIRLGCAPAADSEVVHATSPPADDVRPEPAAETAAPAEHMAATPGSQPGAASMDAAAGEPRTITVLVSSEQNGELEPCGCAEGQYGGLARRDSLATAWTKRGRHVIIADNGGLVLNGSRQSQIKFETTMQIHGLLGTAAVNIGATDLQLHPDDFEIAYANYGVPFVSANVTPATAKYVVVPVEFSDGAVDVGLTGFVDPSLIKSPTPGWQVVAPHLALKPVLEELAGKSDVIVLLAHASRDVTERVLEDLPEPDAVVVADEREDPMIPFPTIGRGVPALAPGTQAKYLARVDIDLDDLRPAGVEVDYEGLSERIPDSTRVRGVLDGYLAILKQEQIPDDREKIPYPTGGSYVGPEKCGKCHTQAYAAWKNMKHSHAFETLVTKHHDFDPDCLECHTTGYGYDVGFQSAEKTPELMWVSCESCHGPGSEHVAAGGGKGYGRMKTPDACLTCHDEPNSPNFDFETYWPKIQHGHDDDWVIEP